MSVDEPSSALASIVIVDDDPGAIQLLRKALSAYTDVRFATNGKDAFRIIEARPPDLVLLDGDMPGENGFQLCTRLKAVERLRDVPVIFVTAHEDIQFEVQALSVGAADFIAKPVSAPRVQLRVKLHLTLKRQLDQLRTLANTDPLTKLANRRVLELTLERECARSRRSGAPLSLLLLDVDHFKAFNDTYGHPAGDRCLIAVAETLAASVRRPLDLVARFGGEEFAVALPDTPLAGAMQVAAQVRANIARMAIAHRASSAAEHVTLSIGAACGAASAGMELRGVAPGQVPLTPERLVRAADGALYLAKQRGRDRVEAAEPDAEAP